MVSSLPTATRNGRTPTLMVSSLSSVLASITSSTPLSVSAAYRYLLSVETPIEPAERAGPASPPQPPAKTATATAPTILRLLMVHLGSSTIHDARAIPLPAQSPW